VLGLTLCALVAGQVLGPPGSPSRSAAVVAILETLVRSVAADSCGNGVCYVSVNGRAPSQRFRERLDDVPHVRPLPASGPPGGERGGARVVNVSSVHSRSDDRAEVDASVTDLVGTAFDVASSCRYHFLRGANGWELQPTQTMCVVT
jgi:hypothetical protein